MLVIETVRCFFFRLGQGVVALAMVVQQYIQDDMHAGVCRLANARKEVTAPAARNHTGRDVYSTLRSACARRTEFVVNEMI